MDHYAPESEYSDIVAVFVLNHAWNSLLTHFLRPMELYQLGEKNKSKRKYYQSLTEKDKWRVEEEFFKREKVTNM